MTLAVDKESFLNAYYLGYTWFHFYYNKGVFTIAYVHWKCLIQSYLCQVMANSPQFLMYAQNLLKTFAVDKENYVECILYLD